MIWNDLSYKRRRLAGGSYRPSDDDEFSRDNGELG